MRKPMSVPTTIGTVSRNGAPNGCLRKRNSKGRVYDPCCGTGRIVVSALKAGLKGYGSDLVDRGWDSTRTPYDFLAGRDEKHDNIVCNPPFDLARQFAMRALQLAQFKVAMIFPVARLNAAHWLEQTPLETVWLQLHGPRCRLGGSLWAVGSLVAARPIMLGWCGRRRISGRRECTGCGATGCWRNGGHERARSFQR